MKIKVNKLEYEEMQKQIFVYNQIICKLIENEVISKDDFIVLSQNLRLKLERSDYK